MAISFRSLLLRQVTAPLAVAVVLGSATYVLTASNSVPATRAGAGAQAVSGYTVSNVHYNLNPSDSRSTDSVTFDVDTAPAAGASMRIRLQSANGAWYACTASGVTLTCGTTSPQATAATADELTVVVGQ